jgi:phosphonopyruvate decarboxylase
VLDCETLYDAFVERGVGFASGVPDSLLKDFCACISDRAPAGRHVIAANEGGAVALAAGHSLATGSPGLVYMQNSGLGNAINPLTSLVDPEVYAIPLLLMIGWRGEPGRSDEPQHVKQGRVTLALLEALAVDYAVLPEQMQPALACLDRALVSMRERSRSFALVVRDGTFARYRAREGGRPVFAMMREDAVRLFADWTGPRDVVVSTTGKTSRELFERRAAQGRGASSQDFLTVGSMGHASQIALGIALARPDRQVFCLDGDGAAIMHLGGLAIIGSEAPENLKHVIVNNGAHDSVGGQPTAGFAIDLPGLARSCGYRDAWVVETPGDFRARLDELKGARGPALLEVRVNRGARPDLGRPTSTPVENKEAFVEFLRR